MSDIWTPPMANTSNPRTRPFAALNRELRRIGFDCKYRHDAAERVVEVLFTPMTDKMRAAVRGASGSAGATGLKTFVHYEPGTPLADVVAECIKKGLEELKAAL